MNALEITQRHLDAWNRHDADAFTAFFAEGGTYTNPRVGQITGQAIATHCKQVWAAFPDASLEILNIGATGGGRVASQWVLHGTHSGPYLDGTPPTGRTVAYPGASFFEVEGDKIRSEHVYIDRQTVVEQLGLKTT